MLANKNNIKEKKIKNIVLANRTDKKAENFANSYNLDFVSFKNYKKCFSKIDIAIFSTSSSSPLISFSEVSDLMKKRKNKKLLLVDLSIPRNIEGNISSISGVDLVSIDGLKDLVNKNYKKRKSETEKEQKNIADEIMRKNISASVIAGDDKKNLNYVSNLFNTDFFKIFPALKKAMSAVATSAMLRPSKNLL